MYKQMRKKNREVTEERAMALLKSGDYGVLGTVGDDGQPYALPLSYVFLDGFIYFHGALEGHKWDNIDFEHRVSFTVVGKSEPISEGFFSVDYESVIVFGEAETVEDETEKFRALKELILKHFPNAAGEAEGYINKAFAVTRVGKITIKHITGKARG